MVTIFFIMFYSSNLRTQLLTPAFEPEVNSEKDIIEQNIEVIYNDSPHEMIPIFYTFIKDTYPGFYDKVGFSCNNFV